MYLTGVSSYIYILYMYDIYLYILYKDMKDHQQAECERKWKNNGKLHTINNGMFQS